MRKALPIVGLFGAFACAPRTVDIIGEVPAEVEWLGVAFLDSSGAPSGATGLLPWGPGARLEGLHQLGDSGIDAVAVIGYRTDDLAAILPADDRQTRLRERPLRRPSATEPLLPTPYFSAGGRVDGAYASIEPGPAPELTADWLPPCPRIAPSGVEPEVYVELCTATYCGASITQVGCTLEANWARCLPDVPERLSVDGRGAVSAGVKCRSIPAREGARFAVECLDCRIDAYLPPSPDRFDVTRVPVRPESPPIRYGAMRRPLQGYLASLAVTPGCPTERALVILDEDPLIRSCDRPQILLGIDVADPTQIERWPIPGGCLRKLLPDPIGGGVIGVFSSPLRVARFDCDGTLAEVVAIDPLLVEGRVPSDATFLAADGAATEIGIALRFESETPGARGKIAIVDSASLVLNRFVEVGDSQDVLAIASAGPGKLLASIEGSARDFHTRVALVQHTDPSAAILPLDAPYQGQVQARTDYLTELGDRWLASAVWNGALTYPALRVFAVDGFRGTANDYTQLGSPSASRAFYDTGDALVPVSAEVDAGAIDVDPITTVGLFDPEDRHFLPGRARIGLGPVSDVGVDSSGAHWMALTWEGVVARVGRR